MVVINHSSLYLLTSQRPRKILVWIQIRSLLKFTPPQIPTLHHGPRRLIPMHKVPLHLVETQQFPITPMWTVCCRYKTLRATAPAAMFWVAHAQPRYYQSGFCWSHPTSQSASLSRGSCCVSMSKAECILYWREWVNIRGIWKPVASPTPQWLS